MESESESIKGLIGCGLVENLASRITFPQANVDNLNGEYVEAAATFKTLESVIWHEDCMRGFVNMDVVLEIGQGCEKRLQNNVMFLISFRVAKQRQRITNRKGRCFHTFCT